MNIETTKIKAEIVEGNGLGYIVINAEDFDASKHEIFTEAVAAQTPTLTPASAPAPTPVSTEETAELPVPTPTPTPAQPWRVGKE